MPEQTQRFSLSPEVFKASSSLHVGNVQYSAWNSVFHWALIWIRQRGPHVDLLKLRSSTGCLQFLPPLYKHIMFPAETSVRWSDNINVFLIAVILINDLLSIPSKEVHVQHNNVFSWINYYNKAEDFLNSEQITWTNSIMQTNILIE